jgi:NADPH-dependent curcumin reductase CurA
MNTYKKLVATRFGRDFEKLVEIQERPIPTPKDNEVVVKVHYAGVNASDVNITAGTYFADGIKPPFGLGVDFAGQVTEVGKNVSNFKKGDKVTGMTIGEAYSEYACVDAQLLFPMPFINRESVALLTGGLPAIVGLETVGEMKSGEKVLITAAAGGVGHIAVQLAKIAGNEVVAVCGSDSKIEFLKELGADRVINHRKEDLGKILKEEYPTGFDLIFENVGRETFDTCVKNVAKRGRVVVCGYISEYQDDKLEVITAPRIYGDILWKSASIRAFLFSDFPEILGEKSQQLAQLMIEGKLKLITEPTVFKGVEQIIDAVEFMHQGKNKGKIVVDIA